MSDRPHLGQRARLSALTVLRIARRRFSAGEMV
ncbi:hypothetical protein FHS54_001366 [Sphingobium vermicomposti]|uniref:Uncharacterized protein n=1 Tax=Sphingobium vermicomposti TaxID=529005 RepID=A0A846M6S4_9SPHN|nr:hypothetical protein [Sphingobium vermicomposti]